MNCFCRQADEDCDVHLEMSWLSKLVRLDDEWPSKVYSSTLKRSFYQANVVVTNERINLIQEQTKDQACIQKFLEGGHIMPNLGRDFIEGFVVNTDPYCPSLGSPSPTIL